MFYLKRTVLDVIHFKSLLFFVRMLPGTEWWRAHTLDREAYWQNILLSLMWRSMCVLKLRTYITTTYLYLTICVWLMKNRHMEDRSNMAARCHRALWQPLKLLNKSSPPVSLPDKLTPLCARWMSCIREIPAPLYDLWTLTSPLSAAGNYDPLVPRVAPVKNRPYLGCNQIFSQVKTTEVI